MARAGIYKSEVLRARDKLRATGRNPSIDAVREELGTGSKSTIHQYLKEIEEEEGGATGTRVAVSEAIQDLVGRLAARVHEEAEERVTAAQTRHAEQLAQHQQAAAALKTEAQSTRQQLEHTQRALAEEKTAHGTTSEALSRKTLECTQLAQQVLDLQERLAAEERRFWGSEISSTSRKSDRARPSAARSPRALWGRPGPHRRSRPICAPNGSHPPPWGSNRRADRNALPPPEHPRG